MLVVNLKAYGEASGPRAGKLCSILERAASKSGKRIVVSPQPQDLHRSGNIEAFAQHVDGVKPGSHTGSILPESIADQAEGTLLNHSEKRLERQELESALEHAKEAGLETIICAQSPEECAELSKLGPDFIAYEPPELIGGEVSVSSAKPEMIEEAVGSSSVDLLTGAGIKEMEDVEKSMELGCKGVLVASGVVKAEKPGEKALELCKGL